MQSYQQALREQKNLGLADGMFNATRIIVGEDGIVRFDNFQRPREGTNFTSQFIDLDEQNAVTDAIQKIRQQTLEDIQNSTLLQDLLIKESWNYDDRVLWESHVSKIASQRLNGIAGLDSYRNTSTHPVTRVTDLADMSGDLLTPNQIQFENDCETMRSIEGIVLTMIDDELLPEYAQDVQNLKISGAYAAVNGGVKFSISQNVGGHAFLVSTLTGNLIEGTADPDKGGLPYLDTGAEYSYKDFIAGRLTAAQYITFSRNDPSVMNFSIAVYGSYYGDGDDAIVEERLDRIKAQDFEGLAHKIFAFDDDAVNDAHFKSAFYQQGQATYTVQKPQSEEQYVKDEGDRTRQEQGVPIPFEQLVTEKRELKTNNFDQVFLGKMNTTLEENGFAQKGKPVVFTTEDGTEYLVYNDDKQDRMRIFNVTGKEIEGVTRLTLTATPPAPKPEPEPVFVPLQPPAPLPEPNPAVIPKPVTVPAPFIVPSPLPPVPQPDPAPAPVSPLPPAPPMPITPPIVSPNPPILPNPAPQPDPAPIKLPAPAPRRTLVDPPAPLVTPQPDPAPIEPIDPVRLCTALQGISFYELVDGFGIRNDKGEYNDADAIKDLLSAAKKLGLSEDVTKAIAASASDDKFMETASAIRAITAANEAAKAAASGGLSVIEQEQKTLEAFFATLTDTSLIVDTDKADDKTPFSKEALEEARELAKNLDKSFDASAGCSSFNPDDVPVALRTMPATQLKASPHL